MVRLTETALGGALNLRLSAGNEFAANAAATALGVRLPTPNTWTAGTAGAILWQAYDEWLILTADGKQRAVEASLRTALAGTHFALTDVSDLRVALRIEGAEARDVLQKGCAVDLHPRVFTNTTCVTAALARVRVTLRQLSAAPSYEILVERSYARYLRDWLADAASEFAVATRNTEIGDRPHF